MVTYSMTRLEMVTMFGTSNANALYRNGMNSVSDVRKYLVKHPYDICKKYHALYYRNIGDVKYKQIVDALNNIRE